MNLMNITVDNINRSFSTIFKITNCKELAEPLQITLNFRFLVKLDPKLSREKKNTKSDKNRKLNIFGLVRNK